MTSQPCHSSRLPLIGRMQGGAVRSDFVGLSLLRERIAFKIRGRVMTNQEYDIQWCSVKKQCEGGPVMTCGSNKFLVILSNLVRFTSFRGGLRFKVTLLSSQIHPSRSEHYSIDGNGVNPVRNGGKSRKRAETAEVNQKCQGAYWTLVARKKIKQGAYNCSSHGFRCDMF